MKRFVFLLVPVVAHLAGCGGGDSGGPTGVDGGTLTVLVETIDGVAVEEAIVRLDPGGRQATTDGSGIARFEGLAAGEYAVAVVRGSEDPVVVEVTLEATGPPPAPVRVVLPRLPGTAPLAIEWDGRTVDWGAPDTLRATLGGTPAGSAVHWVSLDDTYLGQPVLLGRGAAITTGALRPGTTRVEARLVHGGVVVQRERVDVTVAYRASWNVALEGTVGYPAGTTGDVWVEDGVALVARRSAGGISLVDLDGIVEVGRWNQPGLFTQDVKAATGIAYVSHEASARFPYPLAVSLVDVSNPAEPRFVSGIPNAVALRAHNVFVEGSLLTIASQATRDIVVVDVSDPAAPTPLALVAASNATAHDSHTRNGLLFGSYLPLAAGQTGELTIADVSNPGAPAILSRITYPGAFTHSSWVSADGRTLYVADEVVNAPIRIYDVSNPAAPVARGVYQPRLGTIPHQFEVYNDRFAYVAHYKHGVEVVDVADPLAPRLVGFYDTHPGEANDDVGAPAQESLFEGVWGVHWTADGRFVASDLSRGLFVFRYTGD